MPTPALTREDKLEAVELYKKHGSDRAGAKVLGISRTAFQHRRQAGEDELEKERTVQIPSNILGDGHDEDINDLLGRLRKASKKTKEKYDAQRWYEVKVAEKKPYGLIVFGDPHLDDPGCDFTLFEKHLAIANKPHVYGVNIGDTTNNWVGNLMRKYADQETSTASERRLVKWLMTEAGVKWVCWLLGNHDAWNSGEAIHRLIGGPQVPVINWDAQFKLVHPNDTFVKIDASHGRKGNSIWNELHGTLRDAKWGQSADIYITGHTHNYACQDLENAKRGEDAWLLQVSGYKIYDTYAQRNGFSTYQRGSSALIIIDPREKARRRIPMVFEDVEHGYDYLEFMRAKA
jgi:hypothetical protein